MIVAGIETSTDVCSVGIVNGTGRFERSLRESRIHSEKLLVLLDEVMADAGVSWDDVEGLALSAGPGSFTGLRIGASAAKGLLSGADRPFVLVPTFDGIRNAFRLSGRPAENVIVCLDAKQDEWYVQDAGGDTASEPVMILPSDAMRAKADGRIVLTDRTDTFPQGTGVFDLREWCKGDVVAALGRERLASGERHDIRSFEPSYWKEFVVRTTPKAVTPRSGHKET